MNDSTRFFEATKARRTCLPHLHLRHSCFSHFQIYQYSKLPRADTRPFLTPARGSRLENRALNKVAFSRELTGRFFLFPRARRRQKARSPPGEAVLWLSESHRRSARVAGVTMATEKINDDLFLGTPTEGSERTLEKPLFFFFASLSLSLA